MSTAAQPQFSSNTENSRAQELVQPLLRGNGGRWSLIDSGMGLERKFKFKTFKRTWEFMNVVAEECKVQKHHPEWSNILLPSSADTEEVYNTTFIRWTTHSPPGLSEKDLVMAKFCDEQAALKEEIQVEEEESARSDVGRELADRVAREGGDCCVPKKKDG
ncbi:pterin-4-alpha-carbinolamine dehydratase family protein [Rutstroemia sp. NJR-2017a BVV2]|nr:pterin-4-alpha-carbinolamine dehydratase family protein [Rutstroemia sp. NJR-2017a BVV2]